MADGDANAGTDAAAAGLDVMTGLEELNTVHRFINSTRDMVAHVITGVRSIATGGTGASTVAGARSNLGLGNTAGALPVANGGTGKTTAAAALQALGVQSGTFSAPGTSDHYDVVFPVAFANVPKTVLVWGFSNGGSAAPILLQSDDVTKTGFRAVNGGGNIGGNTWWIAVGA